VFEKLALEPDFVVDEAIGVVTFGFVILISVFSVGERRLSLERYKAPGTRTGAVEAARTEALRIGVVQHHVRRDVPGDVAPALEAVFLPCSG
jgi:hypothetical protein